MKTEPQKLKSQEELDRVFLISQATYILQAYSQSAIPPMVLTAVVNIINRVNK